VLRVSPVHGIRHHHGCNGFEPCDGLSGLVQPPYMRIASRQKAISGCPARMFLERSEQHRRGVVKAPGEKVTRRRRTVQARSRRCALYMYRIRCTRCRRLARRVPWPYQQENRQCRSRLFRRAPRSAPGSAVSAWPDPSTTTNRRSLLWGVSFPAACGQRPGTEKF